MKKQVCYILLAVMLMCCAEAQDELYWRYAQRGDVGVAYVEGFEVDSAVTVTATVFLAHNDDEWRWLEREFSFNIADSAADVKLFRLAPRNRPAVKLKGASPVGNDYVVASRRLRTVSVFHLDNEAQYRAILKKELKIEK